MRRRLSRVIWMVVVGLCSTHLATAQVIPEQDVVTEKGAQGLSAGAHELIDLYSPNVYIGKGSLIKFPLTGGQVVTGRVETARPRNYSEAQSELWGGTAVSGRVIYGELQSGAEGKFQLLDDQGTLRSNVEVITSSTQSTLYRISTTESAGSAVSETTMPYSESMCDEDSSSSFKLQ